jgi:5-methyltetrahydrofolate--homocysteine methyltransferase
MEGVELVMLEELKNAVFSGDAETTVKRIEEAIREGVGIPDILNEGLIAGMSAIGVKFKNNEVYVPEVLVAARAMHFGMSTLKPYISKAGIKAKGTVVVGTVKGDLHDIGKNLVLMMLEGAGYKAVDLGIDVEAEKFVAAIEEYKPQVVGLSSLLTTTMPEMQKVIALVKPYQVKVIVGGAPVSQAYADQIGADAYGQDAATAVDKINDLIGSR